MTYGKAAESHWIWGPQEALCVDPALAFYFSVRRLCGNVASECILTSHKLGSDLGSGTNQLCDPGKVTLPL